MFKYFILFIFISFLALYIYGLTLYSPYKTILLIGDKGTGKSTLICKYILQHQKKGWTCYTDAHTNIPYTIYFDPQQLKEHTNVPKSLLCIDEGKLCFDNRQFKSWDVGLTEWFVLQRHYYAKVIICSQANIP